MTIKVMNDNNINVLANEDACLYNAALRKSGVVLAGVGAGLQITHDGLNVTLLSGEAVVDGRHLVVTENVQITVPSFSNGKLGLRIDLAKPAAEQCEFDIIEFVNDEDLRNGGTKKDLVLYSYVSASTIQDFEDLRIFDVKNFRTDRLLGSYTLTTDYTRITDLTSPVTNSGNVIKLSNGVYTLSPDYTWAVSGQAYVSSGLLNDDRVYFAIFVNGNLEFETSTPRLTSGAIALTIPRVILPIYVESTVEFKIRNANGNRGDVNNEYANFITIEEV